MKFFDPGGHSPMLSKCKGYSDSITGVLADDGSGGHQGGHAADYIQIT